MAKRVETKKVPITVRPTRCSKVRNPAAVAESEAPAKIAAAGVSNFLCNLPRKLKRRPSFAMELIIFGRVYKAPLKLKQFFFNE